MAQRNVMVIPAKSSIPKTIPNLLPFHIDYTGPADVSVFMRVKPYTPVEYSVDMSALPPSASQTTGNEDEAMDDKTSTLTRETTLADVDVAMTDGTQPDLTTASSSHATLVSTPTETNLAPGSLSLPSQSAITSTASTSTIADFPSVAVSSSSSPSCPTLPQTDQSNRVVSAFRGRTIHGLEIPLPPGYRGVILQGDAEPKADAKASKPKAEPKANSASTSSAVKAESDATATSSSRGSRSKTAAKATTSSAPTTRKRGPPPPSRLARSAAPRKGQVYTLEDSDQEDDDKVKEVEREDNDVDDDQGVVGQAADSDKREEADEEGDSKSQTAPSGPDAPSLKKLVPAAVFDSIMLWQPDRPVDTGRDEYFRTLHEWVGLAQEIHRTDL